MVIQAKPIPLPVRGRKKKILVLISLGGGGHKTAAESLKQILGSHYDIEINPVMADILGHIDPLNGLTRGHFTGEDLYNFLIKNQFNKILRWIVNYGSKVWKADRIEKGFKKYFQKQTHLPDLIISVTPYINYGTALATQKRDIPFLILPTDLDASTFLQGFPKQLTHHHFKIALAYDDPEIKKITFSKSEFRDEQMSITGFPVRPACLKKYSREELQSIRVKFHLFESHQTVTLIMGAVGGNLILDHVQVLSKLDPREHQLQLQMNICIGHNRKVGKKIRTYLLDQGARFLGRHTFILPSGLVMHIRGYCPDLAEMMAASDIVITKTGSCTVNEAIYLGKKILLDNTSNSTARFLEWEAFNVPFVERNGLGYAFSDNEQLLMLIPSLLKYPETRRSLELPNFEENILKLVQELIE